MASLSLGLESSIRPTRSQKRKAKALRARERALLAARSGGPQPVVHSPAYIRHGIEAPLLTQLVDEAQHGTAQQLVAPTGFQRLARAQSQRDANGSGTLDLDAEWELVETRELPEPDWELVA
jgi:hypothetical protein